MKPAAVQSNKCPLHAICVRVAIIIPALNEEGSIAPVVRNFLTLSEPWFQIDRVVVVDNGSTDRTAAVARLAGAEVVTEIQKGYGAACLRGIAFLRSCPIAPDIVVFADGDGSDAIDELPKLIEPLRDRKPGLVIGSRINGQLSKGALTVPQRFGNWLATFLINIQHRSAFTDLGPFRAIDYKSLLALDMQDRAFGWTIEMQLKCLHSGLPVTEVPVPYFCRKAGKSKISGTVRGSYRAGKTILFEIAKDWLRRAVKKT
jgi:glycosyltransferase involved in cell wall biosynthesis